MNNQNSTDIVLRQSRDLREWYDSLQEASAAPYYLYALVDGVLDKAVLEQIDQTMVSWACLYPDTMAEASSPEVCPYLVDLTRANDDDGSVMRLLFQRAQGKDLVIWIVSRQRLPDLVAHLRVYAEVELPDQRRALLRYYDPSILQILLRVFTPEQSRHLLSAFRVCAYRRDKWLVIEGTDQNSLAPLPGGVITLNKVQYRQLGSESFAETLYHEIKGDLQSPASGLDSARCIEHISELVTRAGDKHQLTQQADLTLFVLIGLNVNLKFDEHPDIVEVLYADPSVRQPLFVKLARINNKVWRQLEKERPAL